MENQYQFTPGEGVRDRALPTSVVDWSYETDLTLVHSSGLRVFFPQRRSGPARIKCLGYGVDDTEAGAQGTAEIEATRDTSGLLSEAESLFHSLPAGSPGAPRSIKRDLLFQLAQQRQAARWEGYRQIKEFQNGAYESDHVSPLTKSAGMVDAKVFILLRDWASEKNLLAALDTGARDLGYTPGEPTAQNLQTLLQRHFDCNFSQTYATNLFPFIRRGHIPYSDLERAALEFAIPQIKIVAPKLVICLGLETFNVLRRINGLSRVEDLAEGLDQSFRFSNVDVWIQAHTGYYGTMLRRAGIDDAWRSMAKAFYNRIA